MERIGTLLVAPSTERKTEPTGFSTALKSATTDLISGLAGKVALAAPYIPGGAVLAGALRPAMPSIATAQSSFGNPALTPLVRTGAATTLGAPVTSGPSPSVGPVTPAPAPGTTPGSALTGSAALGGGDLMEATRALQAQAQTFNLQYLELQESMQRESREFTSLSNVMKVRHDSAKAAINNIH